MPKIEFPKSVIEKLSKTKIEEIKSLFPKLGISLEDEDDENMIIEVNPNRPDWLSVENLARTIRYFTGKERPKRIKPLKNEYVVYVNKNLKKVRPYTVCSVVDLEFNDEIIKSLIQLQEKLHVTFGRNRKKLAIGVYPAEKIKFPIYFLAEKPENIRFVPLGMSDEMNALEILEKHPKGLEFGSLLKGLKMYPFFKDDNGNILSMPPVINSELTGRVDETTKRVFIEVSGFNLHYLNIALNIIIYALLEYGAKVYEVLVKYDDFEIITPKFEWKKYDIKDEEIKSLLGINVDLKLLEKMGYIVEHNSVYVPPYRADVLHKVDILEDLAIAYDYHNFLPHKPNLETFGADSWKNKTISKLIEVFIALGFTEVKTYSLMNEHFSDEHTVKTFNSVNSDYQVLRNTLLFNLLNVAKQNQRTSLRLFETGRIFKWIGNEIHEQDVLGVLIVGEKVSFLRQIADLIFHLFQIDYKYSDFSHEWFIEGRAVKFKDAFLGEIHPRILKEFNLLTFASYLEIPLNLLKN